MDESELARAITKALKPLEERLALLEDVNLKLDAIQHLGAALWFHAKGDEKAAESQFRRASQLERKQQ
jgi:hypothetical protein